ncbi:ankyrin repeat-containing protein BDA1-like [Dioscorea cayenensis subsp. rotundata]|uniref:Ankyrin repeat-containing protein BDA1-like n=1 Tax=Dioscorea cayennensis subsp. rotundata TaxID=55577 RepID=A0AB40BKR1_DIOCR|nr:ankyrin repeat-containing protein BDA1-like [Dioscorea cayenensis subsp. rotundata]
MSQTLDSIWTQDLEEACHTRNLFMLHSLLREDKLLLHKFSSSITASIDNPLHVAALLGHTDLTNEIIIKNPDLASDLNPRALSALHLASAHGHLEIVKLLISKVGCHLCFLKDKDGRLAIHMAALKGRIDILEELIKVCPESARALTNQNESILHLAVQFNSFEIVEFLVKKLGVDDDINKLLNLKDDKGNTILHHAVARRQLQIVKLLLSNEEAVEVNAMNYKGLTALDVLLDSPREYGDLTLGEVIRMAGGKIASEVDPQQAALETNTSRNQPCVTSTRSPSRSRVPSIYRGRRRTSQQKLKKQAKVEDSYTAGQLMVVAALIAIITFQAGLSPPAEFTQTDIGNTTRTNIITNNSNSSAAAGSAVLYSKLIGFYGFLSFDMIGLFASLSIILILICGMARKKKMMMKALIVFMWVAVFSTLLAFSAALSTFYPIKSKWIIPAMLLKSVLWILKIFMLWAFMNLAVYLLRKVGWWMKNEGDRMSNIVTKGGCLLWCMRIGVMVLIFLLVLIFTFSLVVV